MEKRKAIKKNESKDTKSGLADPKLPLTLYFFSKPLLYATFNGIAEKKGIPMRKLVISFAALGLKTYLACGGVKEPKSDTFRV